MIDLTQRSIEIIRAGQFGGAYAACMSFSQYGYSWLRDGSWIAHGMDAAGQRDSARAFHQWVARTLAGCADRVSHLLGKMARGEPLQETDYLPTRFELDGRLAQDDWGNFQLDGYGTWLWSAVRHVERYQDTALLAELRPVFELTVQYLAALWQYPNYDCWEEHRQHIHPATLAAIYGGLRTVEAKVPGLVPVGLSSSIRGFVLANAVASDGHFMKYLGNEAVDASLLWLAVPYRLVEVDDPRFRKTVARIERDIHRPGGGVYRYLADTYYGGGEWPLLTAWLAWVYIEQGKIAQAKAMLTWIEAQASPEGELPEQVAGHLLAPDYLEGWVKKWGTSASPLMWSHGMYLMIRALLKD